MIICHSGNPGGLLDAAVEVASYLVPAGSEIVSARGKTGPTFVYQSSAAPIRYVYNFCALRTGELMGNISREFHANSSCVT
jgi:hypothetical protein